MSHRLSYPLLAVIISLLASFPSPAAGQTSAYEEIGAQADCRFWVEGRYRLRPDQRGVYVAPNAICRNYLDREVWPSCSSTGDGVAPLCSYIAEWRRERELRRTEVGRAALARREASAREAQIARCQRVAEGAAEPSSYDPRGFGSVLFPGAILCPRETRVWLQLTEDLDLRRTEVGEVVSANLAGLSVRFPDGTAAVYSVSREPVALRVTNRQWDRWWKWGDYAWVEFALVAPSLTIFGRQHSLVDTSAAGGSAPAMLGDIVADSRTSKRTINGVTLDDFDGNTLTRGTVLQPILLPILEVTNDPAPALFGIFGERLPPALSPNTEGTERRWSLPELDLFLVALGIYSLLAVGGGTFVWRRSTTGNWESMNTRLVFQKLFWTRFYLITLPPMLLASWVVRERWFPEAADPIDFDWLGGTALGLLVVVAVQKVSGLFGKVIAPGPEHALNRVGRVDQNNPEPSAPKSVGSDPGASSDW